jgi:hypothetical protein
VPLSSEQGNTVLHQPDVIRDARFDGVADLTTKPFVRCGKANPCSISRWLQRGQFQIYASS